MEPYDIIRVGCSCPDLHKSIRVALVNMPLCEKNIEASYRGCPNLGRDRRDGLYQLLNDIVRFGTKGNKRAKLPGNNDDTAPAGNNGIDLVVFPEVSIPHAWSNQIVEWSRKHQIGVVCGLEHRVDRKKVALNEILTVLPYCTKEHHLACLPIHRLKKVYSPHEAFALIGNCFGIPEQQRKDYPEPRFHLFQWRGASFTVYNCYELVDIQDRALFRGKVDFIVTSESNHDTNYFSNIVEAAARDLHCYVVQVNDAEYGDSRIVSPSKTEKMNPLRIKGGDNITFLTTELPLQKLREHQRVLYSLQRDSKEGYKPTPPGFNVDDVEARIRLGGICK